MKLKLSLLYAKLLAKFYNGVLRLHSINPKKVTGNLQSNHITMMKVHYTFLKD